MDADRPCSLAVWISHADNAGRLKQIPQTLYEAAEIDGAGTVRRFVSITLPMLSPVLFFNLVMQIISGFMIFTQAYIVTGGRPLDTTLFYTLRIPEGL